MKFCLRKYCIIIGFSFSFIATISCTQVTEKKQNSENLSNAPGNLEYIEDFFDFGSILQGEVVSHTFRFRNTGEGNLVIKDIIPDCGCTKSKIDKMVFKPNEEGKIEIVFDSKGWRGMQYKSVALRSNSPIREKSVTFKANVIAKE